MPSKPHCVAQNLGQQLTRSGAGHAVDLVVAVHDRIEARFLDRGLEGVQKHLAQLARRDMGRVPVEPAVSQAVADKMFAGRDDALPPVLGLQAAHVGDAHAGDQMRILAEGLFDPSPARVAHHIQHRREALMCADGPHLRAHHPGHRARQLRLPGAGQADDLREDGRVARHVAGAAFLVHHGGDAEAGFVEQKALDRVGCGRALVRFQVARAADAGDLADAVLHQRLACSGSLSS